MGQPVDGPRMGLVDFCHRLSFVSELDDFNGEVLRSILALSQVFLEVLHVEISELAVHGVFTSAAVQRPAHVMTLSHR